MGNEAFVQRVMKRIKIRDCNEIAKKEKYVHRPDLKDIFDKHKRDAGIPIAVNHWGYGLKEVGDFVGIHYSWVSRIARKAKNKT